MFLTFTATVDEGTRKHCATQHCSLSKAGPLSVFVVPTVHKGQLKGFISFTAQSSAKRTHTEHHDVPCGVVLSDLCCIYRKALLDVRGPSRAHHSQTNTQSKK